MAVAVTQGPDDVALVEPVSVDDDTTPGVDDGTTPGVEDGTTPGVEDGTTPGVEDGTTPGVEDGTTPGVEDGITPGVEDSTAPWMDEGAMLGVDDFTIPEVETVGPVTAELAEPAGVDVVVRVSGTLVEAGRVALAALDAEAGGCKNAFSTARPREKAESESMTW